MSFPHLCVGIPCIICHPRFGVRDVETVMGDPRDAEIARLRAEVGRVESEYQGRTREVERLTAIISDLDGTIRANDEDRRIGAALRALVRSYDGSAHVWRGGRYTAAVGFSLSATVRGESRTFFSTTLVEALERAVRE